MFTFFVITLRFISIRKTKKAHCRLHTSGPTMVNQKPVSHFARPCRRRYLISISFACSCARLFISCWTRLTQGSTLDPECFVIPREIWGKPAGTWINGILLKDIEISLGHAAGLGRLILEWWMVNVNLVCNLLAVSYRLCFDSTYYFWVWLRGILIEKIKCLSLFSVSCLSGIMSVASGSFIDILWRRSSFANTDFN